MRQYLNQALRPLFCLLLVCCCLPVLGAAPAGEELLRQVRSTRLDFDRAISLNNLDLEFGPAELSIDRGVLIPAMTTGGDPVELLFIGQARFQVEPPDAIEAGQLELFTGQATLDTAIGEAIFVIANQDVVDSLLERETAGALPPELMARATAIHSDWLDKPERIRTGVESSIFKTLSRDEAYSDYFALWVNSFELGEFVLQLDPEDIEQLTLASFTPLDIQGWDRQRLKRRIRVKQRKGRFLGVRVEDIGAWDVWLSSEWAADASDVMPGGGGFEVHHYDLQLSIARGSRMFRGEARIHLKAEMSGRNTVTLDMHTDLRVLKIVDDQGRELFNFRSGDDIIVSLAEPSVSGKALTLAVSYEGRGLNWVGPKTFDLVDTGSWYPHGGRVDRATYDVTIRWPHKLDLIASGSLVEEGRDGRYRWERRRLEIPSVAFSFVLGDFIIDKRQVGHVELTAAFNRTAHGKLDPVARAKVMDTTERALLFFEETYGQYPLDQLTVVTLPRRFSQSYLGFITMTDTILGGYDPAYLSAVNVRRDTRIAHEVAHQWWGNMVGWWNYRDQWLSEAMAMYSSLLFYTHEEGAGSTFLTDMSAGWRNTLNQRTAEGRTIESLGPIVLGLRLNSSESAGAYRPIVYGKGGVVLAMLARAVGQAQFTEMLRSLVEVASNRVLTTEQFISAMERMSGKDLSGFARQYIYGTGIPQVYYDYQTTQNQEGDWTINGEARLFSNPFFDYRLAHADGKWDLTRGVRFDPEAASKTMMVPVRITLEQEAAAARSRSVSSLRSMKSGILIEGQRYPFEFKTNSRPVSLQLDPRGEILAHFYNAEKNPKQNLSVAARELAYQGDLVGAERAFRKALTVDPGEIPSTAPDYWIRNSVEEGRLDDTRILLALARLYLDQHRIEEAFAELKQADGSIGNDLYVLRMERDATWARFEIQNGDYPAAYKRLRRTLHLAAPAEAPRYWRARLWQVRLTSERMAMTEALALLAIAAHETGRPEEARAALEEARARGVDVTALASLSE
jgi:tetratricopeptide (TPR) repeat protein